MSALTTAMPLTRLDRCDRCGAAAVLRAVLTSGGELLFCGHHARVHGERLNQLRAELTFRLSPPADPTPGDTTSWVPPRVT